jgi:hypothetical protein
VLATKTSLLAIKRHDMAKSQQKNESSSCEFKIKFEYRFDPKESIGKKIGRYYLCYTMEYKIHSTSAWLIIHSRSLQLSTVQCNLNSTSLLRNHMHRPQRRNIWRKISGGQGTKPQQPRNTTDPDVICRTSSSRNI